MFPKLFACTKALTTKNKQLTGVWKSGRDFNIH